MDELTLAELLCARLCHDLSGPVGATAAGTELFDGMDCADPETLALVATTAQGAAARLRFLRAALGPTAQTPMSAAALRHLVDQHLSAQASAAGSAITLVWDALPETIDGLTVRLVLNLIILGLGALPRGGRLTVAPGAPGPRIVIWGEPASLSDDVRAVLVDGEFPSGPRSVQARIIRLLAQKCQAHLIVSYDDRGLTLAIAPD